LAGQAFQKLLKGGKQTSKLLFPEDDMNILLDGMGGDNAPEAVVAGAIQAAREIDATISIIGPTDIIEDELERQGWKGDNIKVVNATEVISNNEAPAMAVRKKKDSTVVVGMNMLKSGEGDVFLSGGSTGALLSAGLLILGRIKGIKRPAIAAFFPKLGQDDVTLLLDCGANVEAKAEYLQQFGVMGSIFVECVKGKENPDIKLLNVGVEEGKGDDLHKEAFNLLKETDINFTGNVEARDIISGVCDVVVTDGFSGNVFLKSSEGAALAITKRIKEKLMEGTASKVGALLAGGKLKGLKKEFDYTEEGGAPILGLKGPVLKFHGSSNANAVYYTIIKAIPYVENDVTGKITETIGKIEAKAKAKAAAAAKAEDELTANED
jgi:glycerol-3-phosphate acyltransferase PlsX